MQVEEELQAGRKNSEKCRCVYISSTPTSTHQPPMPESLQTSTTKLSSPNIAFLTQFHCLLPCHHFGEGSSAAGGCERARVKGKSSGTVVEGYAGMWVDAHSNKHISHQNTESSVPTSRTLLDTKRATYKRFTSLLYQQNFLLPTLALPLRYPH